MADEEEEHLPEKRPSTLDKFLGRIIWGFTATLHRHTSVNRSFAPQAVSVFCLHQSSRVLSAVMMLWGGLVRPFSSMRHTLATEDEIEKLVASTLGRSTDKSQCGTRLVHPLKRIEMH